MNPSLLPINKLLLAMMPTVGAMVVVLVAAVGVALQVERCRHRRPCR